MHRTIVHAVLVLLAAVPHLAAADSDPLAPLDEALKAAVAFEYGKDAGPLERAERIVVESVKDASRRAAVEERLLAALRSPGTRDGKEFLCRQLFFVATARSAEPLEALLADPALSHMARYVLGRLEDPAAAAALRRALSRTTGAIQIGILNTLANRRDRETVPEAARLLGSPDAALARAAARALGEIGTVEAPAALDAARIQVPEALRPAIDHARMACADRLLADGHASEAAGIYQAFLTAEGPKHFRLGALRGLAAARGTEGIPLLLEAVRSGDPETRGTAVELARTVPGEEATKALAGALGSVSPEVQVLLLDCLARRGDRLAAAAVAEAAKGGDETVRVAALRALGDLADGGAAEMLARTAAEGGKAGDAALDSLARLRGGDVGAALRALLEAPDSKVRSAAVRAIVRRRDAGTAGVLLRAAAGADPAVRRQAIEGLASAASPQDLPALAGLVARPKDAGDRPAAEAAVTAAMGRIPELDRRAEALLAALSGAPADARPALLRLLGKAPTAKSLEAVRAALAAEDRAAGDAALAVLADWPDAAPAEDLFTLAVRSSDPARKALALRGSIRLAGLSKDPGAVYRKVLALAERPEDRKMVLAGLGEAGSPQAMEIAERSLEDPALRAEAARAVAGIADHLRSTDPGRAKASLTKVLALGGDPADTARAREVLDRIEEFEGYIREWMVAGPCRQRAKDGNAIFDVVFAPEKRDAANVVWTKLTRGVGPWAIDLAEAVGGDHCAEYARTRVWCPAAAEARLELGSDDAIKAWLNGTLVHANNAERGLTAREDVVAVKLAEGWNDLMLKVINHGGPWGFCCRIRQSDGSALEGLKVEAR